MKSGLCAVIVALCAAQSAAAQVAHHDAHHTHASEAPQIEPDPDVEPAIDAHTAMERGDMAHAGHRMHGALGSYDRSREASGTSWQPDAAEHGGVHGIAGEWMLMGHALFNGVYTNQDGPRGDEKAFVAGMAMGAAQRDFGGMTVNLRAMLSPDPFVGKRGYPLLFASGETADGQSELVDRQHPHDLFMELSASLAQRFGAHDSAFLYAGLPGEPAFGPPVFMHRQSAMDSPDAPISHHWFDSTHITFGVVTAGYVHDDFKLEASRFRGREPDEDRFDLETGALDSTAVRISWNPDPQWALQASWADLTAPEQLHPDEDETRWSISAMRTVRFGEGRWWSTTFAFAQKEHGGDPAQDAWLLESAIALQDRWTFFGRAEQVENSELDETLPAAQTVRRVSLGAVRDWRLADHIKFGVGAQATQNFASRALEASYDGDPWGATAFVRVKID